MLPQQVRRKGKMMQICLDFAGVYCGEIFQDIMKNSAQELLLWEQGEELPWTAVLEPGEQVLGHCLFLVPETALGLARFWGHFHSSLVIREGVSGLQMSIGSLVGQTGVRCFMQTLPLQPLILFVLCMALVHKAVLGLDFSPKLFLRAILGYN